MERENSSTATIPTHPLASAEDAALANAQAAAARITDEEIIPIRVDLTAASATVLGQLPAIEDKREALVAVFGDEATETIDAIRPATLALMDANAEFNSSAERDLEPMAESLRAKRKQLLLVTRALVERDVAPKSLLDKQQGGIADLATHADTTALASWLLSNQARIAPFCKFTEAEILEIKNEATRFLEAVGLKGAAGTGAAAAARGRAFTHFARVYDRLRKLITYVRWHVGDQDEIAPSIYAGRTRKGNEPLIAPLPAVPVPVPPPGMPGAPPFVRNP